MDLQTTMKEYSETVNDVVRDVSEMKQHTNALKEINFDLSNTMGVIDKKLKNQRGVFSGMLDKIKEENATSRSRIKKCEDEISNIFMKVSF